ncbi:murein DD-endopeptidase MepM/ murein hydrolase activator NlpD [Amaricoccus macauensis]|uniref:Murein DD-endopeptidase MepM/ murein hydrolase activator NlpD n=1 Tax=Amaricoccus macauensis TaxID=57001 RepID=A0A840SLA2_9RHOB|nr:murein DD-endopeptidase MepM/ murein hydrolase activator NlpD [Amaricoccus macauensis]
MGALRRRLNGGLARIIPEKHLLIQTPRSTRSLRFTPLVQLMSGTAFAGVVGWVAVLSATLAIEAVGPDHRLSSAAVLQSAYQERLEDVAAERDQRAAEARSAQERFQVAMEQISRQQSAILTSVEERRELSTALDLMRARLADAVAERDAVSQANERLVNEVSASLGREADGAGLTDTLGTVSQALSEAVVARDRATADRAALSQQLADLELKARVDGQRQDEMIDELSQAVAMSFGPLEKIIGKTDLDVDGLIATVRSNYSGVGGPLGDVSVSTRSIDGAENSRLDQLMLDIDRMNLMRVAVEKLPVTMPVLDTFRFSSPFGYRHDPKGAGRRMHAGVDMAGPRGTPIYATADGVVITAGRESGYGNVVKIRHDFGLETVYGHLSRIRVKVGQQISRNMQIGDMGSTGRSTGSHLHYEVRVNDQPVNPMTYLEAAKDF